MNPNNHRDFWEMHDMDYSCLHFSELMEEEATPKKNPKMKSKIVEVKKTSFKPFDNIEDEMFKILTGEQELKLKEKKLREEIDTHLDNGDKEAFMTATNELNKVLAILKHE